ncbi:Uncharacterized protein family UPF0497, trans-membrane plant [Cynara cardunculus var. scolymus]|uniref:CASP-like protein n=1 Tax=Cynara cardunculus var. scolymus TaxID=59895 RepID=A0A103XH05_CYNCS|nr:Uncharacterized protein family UPF0497, trans-membrane plant [Cynara cardunculus var. scolymus]
MEGDSTAISIVETPKERKGKAPLLAAPPGGSSSSTKPVVVQPAAAATKGDRYKRGLAVFDVVVRLAGVATALAAAIAMASTEQTLPFFTQFFQFQAGYDDLPAFTFFVVANAITATAGGAASIVYLAHNGNGDANWPAICQQFNDFCQKASGAVVASFLSVVVLMVLVVLSAFSL